MRILILIIILVTTFSACNNSEKRDAEIEKDYVDYFYPTDSLIPFIYVFQDENDPLNEKIQRIYRLESPTDTNLVVEYFNANFRITEAFSYSIDSFLVNDHMIVDGDGLKRKAKVTSNSFFPLIRDKYAHFISDFPSHLDSIALVYQSKKSIINDDYKIELFGKTLPAVLVKDSVIITFVNTFTKQGSSQNAVVNRVFAKGYGLVQWSSDDGAIVYDLKRILNNDWWQEVAQGPEVKRL
ncbi:MAG TPA: hypothetical protein VKX29_04240 [Brumimicrobium sp.]|nr:hypothetical protein [Brumimicrobium sp.]